MWVRSTDIICPKCRSIVPERRKFDTPKPGVHVFTGGEKDAIRGILAAIRNELARRNAISMSAEKA